MNLNSIDLNKIRVFHSVVKNGSYRLAGEELGLTRSAISQSMTTLEAQIGVSLFQRKGRRLFPTNDAVALSHEFAQYHSSLESALRKVQNTHQDVTGTVRIGSYYEFAKSQLTPLIHEFCSQHPQARFRFVFDSPSKLEDLIDQGKIDLNFSIFPHKGSHDIESFKVFNQELVLIASKRHSKQARQLESLLQLPLIEYYSSHKVLPRWIQTHFGRKRPKIQPQVFAASAEMLIELVSLGTGVGIAPLYLLDKRNDLEIIRPTNKKLLDYIWLNQFKGQFENSAHEHFYNFVQSRIQK